MAIPLEQLQQANLNLLVYFVVLVEERSVSRAAARLRLTQPAVSRALQRLREMFRDELLVRVAKGYQPTVRGQDLLQELAVVLPHINKLISGKAFDPSTEEATFKIAVADSLLHLYGPVFTGRHALTPNISFRFLSYKEDRYTDLETNGRDLVLDADFRTLGPALRKEKLFEDEFVCAVAKESPHRRKLSLAQYLDAEHVSVTILDDRQAVPDLALAKLGVSRKCTFSVPYFEVALRMVSRSNLIATLPGSLATTLINPETTRLVRPPKELEGYRYIMVWHKRQELDVHHVWLRQAFRDATQDVLALLRRRRMPAA